MKVQDLIKFKKNAGSVSIEETRSEVGASCQRKYNIAGKEQPIHIPGDVDGVVGAAGARVNTEQ